jgi:16S rRNA (guanine527-N7)-methyltransferase
MDPGFESEVRGRVEAGLTEIFGAADPGQADQLARLVILLAQWAPRMNLTGHRDPLDMTDRLVLDAAALVACLPELAQSARLADLGSGAGFPGLPIAILRPTLEVLLVESRQKRNHFQREARRQLGLDRVRPLLGRSEQLDAEDCDVVVAQAMTQPEEALAHMRPWAKSTGLLVLPASELAAQPAIPATSAIERRSYRVPFTGVHRQLWLVRLSAVPAGGVTRAATRPS